jgi:LPS export ABC transporter permease LptF
VILIDRYILREFGPFFVIALGATTFVLILDKLLKLGSFILSNHLDFPTFLRLLGYTLATVSGLILPIAFLLASILTWSRLSTDSEYLVLKAAGLSLYRMLVPLFMASIVVYGASNFALMYGSPWGFQGLRHLIFEVARRQVYYHLRPREFHDTFQGLVLYVERIRPELRQLEGVFIADTRMTSPQVITARSGELVIDPKVLQVALRLRNGVIHRYVPADKRYYILRFGRYDVRLELGTYLARQTRQATRPRELYPSQLQDEITRRKAAKQPYRQLVLFRDKLLALPFASIIFAGLGPVLGLVQTRSSRSGGYVLGLVAIFVYYIFLTASNALGEGTALPPVVVAWLPNLCMGWLTALLLRQSARGAASASMYALWLWVPRIGRRRRSQPTNQTRSGV